MEDTNISTDRETVSEIIASNMIESHLLAVYLSVDRFVPSAVITTQDCQKTLWTHCAVDV